MNTKLIGRRIQADRAKITRKYQSFSFSLMDIAKIYGVTDRTIYNHLKSWGVEIDHNALQKEEEKHKHFKRRFSQELKAKMAYNTKVNNKRIKQVKFENRTEEQRLVNSVIQHPIIG